MNWNNWLYADRLGEEKQSPKPQTHADRIRAMSDEELAEYFSDCLCPRKINCSGSCDACIMEWLSKPAEED